MEGKSVGAVVWREEVKSYHNKSVSSPYAPPDTGYPAKTAIRISSNTSDFFVNFYFKKMEKDQNLFGKD